jgi:hypothetical protein
MALRPLLMLAAACGLLAAPAAVPAAVLIEAQKAGEPLRLVVDRARELVLVTSGGRRMLVDLAGGLVHLQQGDGAARRTHARFRPGHDAPAPYRVELFGPGPMVAGNGSSYHVLFDLERVCAETMLSSWMAPFVDPAVRAIALLEQLSAPAPADACAAIPFTTYAAAGWPLMAGKADHPTFVTTAIRFDYTPVAGELSPPAAAREVALEDLAALIALPPS